MAYFGAQTFGARFWAAAYFHGGTAPVGTPGAGTIAESLAPAAAARIGVGTSAARATVGQTTSGSAATITEAVR